MKIAFIILTYNSQQYIENCIKSILSFDSLDFNAYIVDNGSNDKSVEIIKSFNDKRIILIELDKNYGTTISRNKGLHLIKDEDYVCILDSDTEVNQKAMVYMIDYLKNHIDVGLVGPSMKNKQDIYQIPYRRFPNLKLKLYKAAPIKSLNEKGIKMESYQVNDKDIAIECDYLISACWMMPKTTIDKVGYLDERIFYSPEDVEYCIRIWENNLRIVHLKEPVIIHHYQRISKKKLFSKVNFSHFYCLLRMLYENRKFLKQWRK
ncbi:MAG: glycosyltransferase [Erysipelotrichaceae bacterium]|nr:glycosyltransferase [Erysipelotrichaceae bacterium]